MLNDDGKQAGNGFLGEIIDEFPLQFAWSALKNEDCKGISHMIHAMITNWKQTIGSPFINILGSLVRPNMRLMYLVRYCHMQH